MLTQYCVIVVFYYITIYECNNDESYTHIRTHTYNTNVCYTSKLGIRLHVNQSSL